MLSVLENLDIMLCEGHSEREVSVNSNSARRPESANSNMFENDEEHMYLNHREMGLGNDTDPGQNSTSANSNIEINVLSSELNSKLSSEMDKKMNSVNTQIQRAIIDTISNQLLPQIQNALKAGSGHVTQNRWNVLAERPENDPEDYLSEKIRNNSRSEPIRNRLNDDYTDQAYDNIRRESCYIANTFNSDQSRDQFTQTWSKTTVVILHIKCIKCNIREISKSNFSKTALIFEN